MTGIVEYGILDSGLCLQDIPKVARSGSRIAGIGDGVDGREGNRIELEGKVSHLPSYHSASSGKR